MPVMPAMQVVVQVLESEGVECAFGIPGAAILPLYDAMRGSSIRHLTVRHEEGATHAAVWLQPSHRWHRGGDRNLRAGGNQHGHGPVHSVGRLGPDPHDHRPGAGRAARSGGVPGGRHRRDRQAGGQEELHGHQPRAAPVGLPRGVPDHARRTPRAGAHRPSPRRPADADRIQLRDRRAAGDPAHRAASGRDRGGPRHAARRRAPAADARGRCDLGHRRR